MQGINLGWKAAALLLLAMLAAPGQAADAPGAPEPERADVQMTPADAERLQALLEQAFGEQAATHPAESQAAFDALVEDPAFQRVPQEKKAAIYSAGASMALDGKDLPRARDLYLQAITANSTDSDDWSTLSWVEYRLKEQEAAAAHMAEFARRWPDAVDDLHDSFLFGVLNALEDASPSRLDLLQALASSGWKDSDRGADSLWFDLAMIRVQRGERDLARAAIEKVASPRELIQLRSDRRFDGLFDPTSPRFDVALMARQRLERLRTLLAAAPLDLELVGDVAAALQMLGEIEAGIAVVDETLQRDEQEFVNADAEVWLLNGKALALQQLGRFEEAVAVMQRASTMTEESGVNVSQSINLAEMHCANGNWKQALEAVAAIGDVSAYGRVALHSVLHCGRLQQGDRSGADKALAYLREHRALSTTLYVNALLREDRLDLAAAALIAALDSEKERSESLVMVQEYLPQQLTPIEERIDARWERVLQREDVNAAIDRVGRRQRYEILEP